MELVANGVRFGKPAIPVISPASGKVLTCEEDFGSEFVVRHCRNKVDMLGALQSARDLHILDEKLMGVELGPEPIVIKMVKEVAGSAFQTFASSRKDESTFDLLAVALSTFYTAGAHINWTAYHADFLSCQVVLDLPAYAWVCDSLITFCVSCIPIGNSPMLTQGCCRSGVQVKTPWRHPFDLSVILCCHQLIVVLHIGSQRVLDTVCERLVIA